MEGPIKAQDCAKMVFPSQLMVRTEMRSEGIMAQEKHSPQGPPYLPNNHKQDCIHVHVHTRVCMVVQVCACAARKHMLVCAYMYM